MTKRLQEILEEINPNLAELTQEIEKLIYVSPRAAMQTTRTMAETLVRQVAELENMEHRYLNFGEVQLKLKEEGILTTETDNAIHYIRRNGNIASHDGTRKILIREALTCWESQHLVLAWFIETYTSPEIVVPDYVEPVPTNATENQESLLEHIELLMQSFGNKNATNSKSAIPQSFSRKIYYKNDFIEIPDFLRDAFLLPQRFPKSTTFLIRLNGEQQARIMSELPHQLEGIHQHVKRFKESNDECLFQELKCFVKEEIERKTLMEQYKGEVLLFYKNEFIILTEALGEIELTKENFPGQTSLLNSLNEQGFRFIKDLPKELVLLGKYRNVGEVALLNLFNQLKVKSFELTAIGV